MTNPLDLLKKLTEHVSYTPGVGTPIATQKKIMEIMKRLEELQPFSGFDKWYVPGSVFSIENCPEHAAFFAAGADYRERLLSLSNRSGKALADRESVLTARGWVRMRDVREGTQ